MKKIANEVAIWSISGVIATHLVRTLIRLLWPVQCRCCNARSGRDAYRCWNCGMPLRRS